MNALVLEIIGSENNNDEYEIVTPTEDIYDEWCVFQQLVFTEYKYNQKDDRNQVKLSHAEDKSRFLNLNKSTNYIKVLIKGVKIYGYIACGFKNRSYGTMYIMLLNEAIGKGYGTKMITILIDYAKSINSKGISLIVHKDNISAIRLYKKFGFNRVTRYNDLPEGHMPMMLYF